MSAPPPPSNLERITLAIALLALLASAWQGFSAKRSAEESQAQTELVRQQSHQSVRPLLQASPQFERDRAGLFLRNLGLGPAVITRFTVKGGSLTLPGPTSEWITLLDELKQPPECYRVAWPRVGDILAVADTIPLVSVRPDAPPACMAFASKLFIGPSSFTVEIEYKSIYEEPFKMSAESSVAIDLGPMNPGHPKSPLLN